MTKIWRILEIIALSVIIGTIIALPAYIVYLVVDTGAKVEKMKQQVIEMDKNIEFIERVMDDRDRGMRIE